jgi:hypothetical protein
MDSTTQEVGKSFLAPSFIEFPLITWDKTSDFLEKGQKLMTDFKGLERMLQRRKPSLELVSPRFDFNCNPEVYLVSGQLDTSIYSFGDATLEAGKKGVAGWFRFSDIEDFLRNKGIIFQGAMFDLGWYMDQDWKPVKTHSDPNKSIWYERRSSECPILTEHPVIANHKNHLGRMLIRDISSKNGDEYYFIANPQGKLFFYTKKTEFSAPISESMLQGESNPFEIPSRGFIESRQQNAILSFENILLKNRNYSGIATYISARKPTQINEKPFYEAILPDNLSKAAFHRFAIDLSEKIA